MIGFNYFEIIMKWWQHQNFVMSFSFYQLKKNGEAKRFDYGEQDLLIRDFISVVNNSF